ncbi:MAG: hypothetical protein AAF184_04315, partial [Pseudomonadota bacterium]
DDSSTWEWTDNPALCAVDVSRDARLGAAWSSDFVGWDSIAAAANRCEETETVYSGVGDGSTTQITRFRCDGVMSTQTETLENIDAIVECMAGNRGFPAGVFELQAGGYDVPVITLTDEDRQGTLTWQPNNSRLDAYNSTRGLYWSPSENAFTDFAPREVTSFISDDGGQKWRDFRLPMVDAEQRAQWLAAVSMNVARLGVFEGVFSHRALGVKRGETIAITNELRDWVAKEFRVTKKSIEPVIGDDGHAIGLTVRLAGYESLPTTWQVGLVDLVDTQPRATLDSTAPTPLAPSGLAATGRAGSIALDWTNPDTEGIAYTEVWRVDSADGNRANAERISTQTGESMVDAYTDRATNTAMGPDEDYDYWVRNIGRSKAASAWHPLSATAGVSATSLESTGVPGPPGPPGADGIDGADGLPGADGQDGAPGADGVPGQDGAPGADGQDGAPGADGQDGADGTPALDLRNDNPTTNVRVDETGAGDFSTTEGRVQLFEGDSERTSSATLSSTSSGGTFQLNTTDDQFFVGPKGSFRFTDVTSPGGTMIADITASYSGQSRTARVTVTTYVIQNQPLGISFSPATLSAFGLADDNSWVTIGSITANNVNGAGPFGYSWSLDLADFRFVGGTSTNTVTVQSRRSGAGENIGNVICTITDVDSSSATKSTTVLGGHGSGGPTNPE